MDAVVQKIKECIRRNGLLSRGDKVLIAFSGGKDSMVLLDVLCKLRDEFGITVGVYHLDHKMRGEDSFKDALFAIRMSSYYQVPAFIEQYNFLQKKEKGKSFEQQAREYRYARLWAIAHEFGYTKIATAHTKSDQVETILMRLFQGTGLLGLRGIAVRYNMIIRPLLEVTSEEIYHYIRMHNLSFRVDESNKNNIFLRNYIRNEIVPIIRKRFPTYENTISDLQKQTVDAVETILYLIKTMYPDFIRTDRDQIAVREDAISHNEYIFKFFCAYIVSHYLNKYVNSEMLHALYSARGSKKKNVTLFASNDFYVYRRRIDNQNYLLFTNDPIDTIFSYTYILSPGDTIFIKEVGVYITCTIAEYTTIVNDIEKALVLRDTGIYPITVRNRRSGDCIIRKCGRRTLKRLFIDYKLTPEEKLKVPIIEIDSCIAAVMFEVVTNKKSEIAFPFLPCENEKVLVIRYWSKENV